jgi:hypothetical protein
MKLTRLRLAFAVFGIVARRSSVRGRAPARMRFLLCIPSQHSDDLHLATGLVKEGFWPGEALGLRVLCR